MTTQHTKIAAINRYGKFYFVFEHSNGEKQYFKAPEGGLEVTTDPNTGRLVPINPIQETRQVLSKELSTNLKQFRKQFIKFAGAYWDLVPGTTVDRLKETSAYRPDLSIDPDWITLDETQNFNLLKFLRANAWDREYKNSNGRYQAVYTVLDRDTAVKRFLARYTRAVYHKYKEKHVREAVPLGEMCPEDRY